MERPFAEARPFGPLIEYNARNIDPPRRIPDYYDKYLVTFRLRGDIDEYGSEPRLKFSQYVRTAFRNTSNPRAMGAGTWKGWSGESPFGSSSYMMTIKLPEVPQDEEWYEGVMMEVNHKVKKNMIDKLDFMVTDIEFEEYESPI